MDSTITYLNTDFELISKSDLSALAEVLASNGIPSLHVTRGEDGLWYANFETEYSYVEPEPNIAAMLTVIESLEPTHRTSWDNCKHREFNIGYDCGDEPWAFNHELSANLLGRMSAAGASLRVTLYPDRD